MFRGIYNQKILDLFLSDFQYYVEFKEQDNLGFRSAKWVVNEWKLEYWRDYMFFYDNSRQYALFMFKQLDHAIQTKLMWSE